MSTHIDDSDDDKREAVAILKQLRDTDIPRFIHALIQTWSAICADADAVGYQAWLDDHGIGVWLLAHRRLTRERSKLKFTTPLGTECTYWLEFSTESAEARAHKHIEEWGSVETHAAELAYAGYIVAVGDTEHAVRHLEEIPNTRTTRFTSEGSAQPE